MRLKILIILLIGFGLINYGEAREVTEESQVVVKEAEGRTRIVISTTAAAKFSSSWLNNPSRLVVEFQSENVVSKIDNEVIVNQGVIKKITPFFFERGRNRPLKSLTFELTQKAPYKIWQEDNAILIDIQAPLETPPFSTREGVLAEGEASGAIMERLAAMDAALMQITESQAPQEAKSLTKEAPAETSVAAIEVVEETAEKISKSEIEEVLLQDKVKEVVLPKAEVSPTVKPTRERKSKAGLIFLFAGLTLILGLGFSIWHRHRLDIAQDFKKLRLDLDEKDKLLEHERIIRKAVEETSLQREKEYQQVKGSLIKKGLLKRELSLEEKERPWILGKSPERRQFLRLALSRDYSRTIILRIEPRPSVQEGGESPGRPESIKSFANNISLDGLCFETKEEFKVKGPINLRLFFYGDIVPMMKIQAHIVWKRVAEPINYYGVYFGLLDEKDRSELNHYIESKIE